MTDGESIAALAALARRREAGLRAALARMTETARAAHAEVVAAERACEAQRHAWQEALSRGGIYGPREAAGASHSVEAERTALGQAQSRYRNALAGAEQAEASLRTQREHLQANARKQEKLRELLALYRS